MQPPLPDWPLEVIPQCRVSMVRTPEQYIRTLLQLDVLDHRYLKGPLGTRCNWYVHDGLLLMGRGIERKDGWPLKANDMQQYFIENSATWQRMQWQDAVMSAGLGYPTVATLKEPGHGHVAFVLPSSPTNEMNIMTAQAGADNFYGREIIHGFGSKLAQVIYFGCP